MPIRRPGPLNGWNSLARMGGKLKLVDQGVDSLTGGAATENIAFSSTLQHPERVVIEVATKGYDAIATRGFFISSVSAAQFQLSSGSGGTLRAGYVLSWYALEFPSGSIERGSDTESFTAAGNTVDVALVNAIDLVESVPFLPHYGYAINFDTDSYLMYGYLKKHATDANKLQMYGISNNATRSFTFHWWVWTP